MADPTTTDLVEQTPATRQALAAVTFERRGAGGGIALIPQNFEQVVLMAQMMARAGPAVPKHLRDNPGVCMAVIVRAVGWEMDPFAVATKTYFVSDQVAYESQLVSAVVNMRAPVKGRPKVRYEGDGVERRCIFGYTMDDGEFLEYESPRIKDIPVKNSPLWKGDPDQQLFYYSARAWARRWVPEVLMGVYTPDEAQLRVMDEEERPRTFEALEESARDAEFQDKVAAPADAPKDAAKPKPRARAADKAPEAAQGTAEPPQGPAGGVADPPAQAAAASPASGAGTETGPGTHGSGEPTTKISRKTSADGTYTVTVSFAEPGGLADAGEIYMIGHVEYDGPHWVTEVHRTAEGDLLFWQNDKPLIAAAGWKPPATIWAYTAHAERPTQTASVPTAEAELGSLGYVTPASTVSAAGSSGPAAADHKDDEGALSHGETDPAVEASEAEVITVPQAFAEFVSILAGATEWPQTIAPALAGLRKTPDWASASEDARVRLHTIAFHRLEEMIAGGYRLDFLDDMHAYRCYIDQEKSADALDGNHRVMERSKLWLDLQPGAKDAFETAIRAQKERIKAATGGRDFA